MMGLGPHGPYKEMPIPSPTQCIEKLPSTSALEEGDLGHNGLCVEGQGHISVQTGAVSQLGLSPEHHQ